MADPIKEAFSKVKEDISQLQSQISDISMELKEVKRTLIQTDRQTNQTDRQIIQTVPQEIKGLNHQNTILSTGNKGVQTDRQTNQQTDNSSQKFAQPIKQDPIERLREVSEIVDSLDSLKKELRSKIKKLTSQEMLVFSTLYQCVNEGLVASYPFLAEKTNLSESSIRDYVLKVIKKGIPVDKTKENNKKVVLSIPEDFRKIASLPTIMSLREL